MSRPKSALRCCLCLLTAAMLTACDKPEAAGEAEPAVAPPAKAPAKPASPHAAAERNALPPSHPPIGDPAPGSLTGIAFDVPEDWVVEPASPSEMGPKAIYRLAKVESDEEDASVRITYFPGMKGKDDLNIERWVAQVRRPDGTTSTKEDAEIVVEQIGDVRLTIVDITGSVVTGMGVTGPTEPNQRLIAAIVDHPEGPHYVKATGGIATMEKWAPSVYAFLKSAKVK